MGIEELLLERARKKGVKKGLKSGIHKRNSEIVLALRNDGMEIPDIARFLNISMKEVIKIINSEWIGISRMILDIEKTKGKAEGIDLGTKTVNNKMIFALKQNGWKIHNIARVTKLTEEQLTHLFIEHGFELKNIK